MGLLSRQFMVANLFLLGGVVALPSSAAPIDDFSTPQSSAVDATEDAAFASSAQAGPIGGTVVPIGGQREIAVSKANNAVGAVEAVIFPGAALYDALGAVVGQLLVEYSGLGGIDLSGFDTLAISGLLDTSAASGAGTTLGISLEDNLNNIATSSFMLTESGPFLQEVPLINFAAVDISNVTEIKLGSFDGSGALVDIPAGGDITFLRFEAANNASEMVPEANSLRIWGVLGILCLGVAYSRYRRSGASGLGHRA